MSEEKSQIDARMIQKRSSTPLEVPTIPASDNHTDGSWIPTDIYDGEFFLNIPDQKLYQRVGAAIIQIGFAGGGLKKKKIDLGLTGVDEDVFLTDTPILGDYEFFEDGIISARDHSQTGANEITTTTDVPAGTVVTILY